MECRWRWLWPSWIPKEDKRGDILKSGAPVMHPACLKLWLWPLGPAHFKQIVSQLWSTSLMMLGLRLLSGIMTLFGKCSALCAGITSLTPFIVWSRKFWALYSACWVIIEWFSLTSFVTAICLSCLVWNIFEGGWTVWACSLSSVGLTTWISLFTTVWAFSHGYTKVSHFHILLLIILLLNRKLFKTFWTAR